MTTRKASATWNGTIEKGEGTMAFGAFEGEYSFGSRFEDGAGTNPEELIGAAHAGCFSMALSGALGREGYEPRRIETSARVHLGKVAEGFAISRIELECEAEVEGIGEEEFRELARGAKESCPVSKALAGVDIDLQARLA